MRKINLEVLKPWIATRITELLGDITRAVILGVRFRAAKQHF
jgi:hypothetical protein